MGVKMTIRPKEDLYGQRVGIIVDARALPESGCRVNECICLEGKLSKECMPTSEPEGEFSKISDPIQITLEGGVTAPNISRNAEHPLSAGVESVSVSNDYVIAMYVPKEKAE
jgi:hypothetical protein